MAKLIDKIFGNKSERDIKTITPIINEIKACEDKITSLSNDGLREKTLEFKQLIKENVKVEEQQIEEKKNHIANQLDIAVSDKEKMWKEIDALEKKVYEKSEEMLKVILPEAFNVIKETAKRFTENSVVEVTASEMDKDLSTKFDHINIKGSKALYDNEWMAGGSLIKWEMIHYDVQLVGGCVLHEGKIAEMATGEGKTLVATLPIYLNALSGKGVHLVTVNDYLAKRDSEWMGNIFEFHGLRVDCIDRHQPNTQERRNAYLADVTYGTNNEFGFDYLRDNMATDVEDLVQRPHNYAIVDEVDSVLVDDARTPLIISGPTTRTDKQEFEELKPLISNMFMLQRNYVTKTLAQAKNLLHDKSKPENEKEGFKLLLRCQHGMPKNKALIKFLSEPGMKTGLQKTENFYMAEQNKNMHIVDDELYFVIEEKNNAVDLTDNGIDILTAETSDPTFYILPDIGSEIAEMAKTDLSEKEKKKRKEKLIQDFAIKSERVHTINQLLKAYTLFELDVEYVIIENKIKIVDEQTGRVMEGRRYSDGLHQAIEAKENVKVEASTQTYATITLQNYFRMYKKLAGMTGTAETEAGELWDIYKLDVVVIPTNRPIKRLDDNDLVYRSKREKFNAVAAEVSRLVDAGRPVLVGTTSVETSELLSRMLSRKNIKHNVLNAKLHAREADIVREAGQSGTVTIATNMAGRGTDIKLGAGVKEAGGLAIIGTERHESRRVDRQLRGRSGRQGDPGSTQFFVSLEDDLMRLFGSERIAKAMDRIGYEDGESIQHSQISKSIERAQKKVEENNFGTRKRLLEYDDVMNTQRTAIYKKRHHALYGERLSLDIADMMFDVVKKIIEDAYETRDFEGLKMDMLRVVGYDIQITETDFLQTKIDKLADQIFENAYKNYQQKRAFIAEQAWPIIQHVHENESANYKDIAIPFEDGNRKFNAVANLEKAYANNAQEVVLAIEKSVALGLIDNEWKEHLREMDDLKQSVQNASYEQKDPLLIYKFESYELFRSMLFRVYKEVVSTLLKGKLPLQEGDNVQEARRKRSGKSNLKMSRDEQARKFGHQTQAKEKTAPVKVEKKVGRNDPCPCGSGKKYKYCHGKED